MNRMSRLLCFASVLILVGLVAGCKSTKQTENLLSEAGFKIVRATTAQQQAHLKSLPAGKISRVNREGILYFVYPDASKNILYVGRNSQYEDYKNDLWLNNHASENPVQADYLDGATWEFWEGWGPLW